MVETMLVVASEKLITSVTFLLQSNVSLSIAFHDSSALTPECLVQFIYVFLLTKLHATYWGFIMCNWWVPNQKHFSLDVKMM